MKWVTLLAALCCAPSLAEPLPPIRFLLTFDDGPSIAASDNPTLSVLEQLAINDVQPDIKAVFFVQTRNANGGGTARGKRILRGTHLAGHVLGLHSASPEGHLSHTGMPLEKLRESLRTEKRTWVELPESRRCWSARPTGGTTPIPAPPIASTV